MSFGMSGPLSYVTNKKYELALPYVVDGVNRLYAEGLELTFKVDANGKVYDQAVTYGGAALGYTVAQ